MKKDWKLIINPFRKVAGCTALLWGLCGLLISIVLAYYSGYHYHGLLHFGPAPNDAFWHYAVEVLLAYLFPASFFYAGGILLSKSEIRIVDVFGTTAFAQLPLVLYNLFHFLPSSQRLLRIDINESLADMLANPTFMLDALVEGIGSIFLIWTMIWMFQALRVSCNLKGVKLGVWYAVAVVVGEVLCRFAIRMTY